MRTLLVLLIVASGAAPAAGAGFHLVTLPEMNLETQSGAFVSVCVEPDYAKTVLESADHVRAVWGVGAMFTERNAAEQLPYFSTPVLITAECLPAFIAEFERLHPDREIVLREIAY